MFDASEYTAKLTVENSLSYRTLTDQVNGMSELQLRQFIKWFIALQLYNEQNWRSLYQQQFQNYK